jgi:RNA polymerase sigma factor (sigma-70 family)
VLKGPPEAILAILRSAQSRTPDPGLDEVLEAFRRQWRTIARRRYPNLEKEDVEDAIQSALLKLVTGDALETLKDATRLEAWARSIFVHSVLDLARHGRRHRRGRIYLGDEGEDAEEMLRDHLPSPELTPEERSAYRERLEIVARCVQKLDIARLKFVEDLTDKEIAARYGLTRDGVAGKLKRIRQRLRSALGEGE